MALKGSKGKNTLRDSDSKSQRQKRAVKRSKKDAIKKLEDLAQQKQNKRSLIHLKNLMNLFEPSAKRRRQAEKLIREERELLAAAKKLRESI